ncbi:alpha/beta fold hydrolase [Glutamicibacter protophormiae]|uniref:2-hydroxy-6-oxonona-2,4-dienedioate hydrolase n=1 Tax=Glutamicibacter protophormiae TaxID=37930 RepID=A0ABS4XMY5_GLUPR|nr:alpha/beta fold hydrolase [Glutamicibacter protophormiae]MBP2397837.1 2-hydroxy-6-oxonona-2,4-dienedioate hydrolase [Glutamicibacter protophormiae]QRQ78558.1 alpha/beta fold hydrolase [Glutamicibacter protophormiae]WPR64627.1 alpha/beta fold hydrolase [Glutamicibacter protophormiae]WPR68123.1 alpha/beta fold hydrolase [Glutamicibacter protophormiae]GGL86223.1 alpha/beta hydrolase [Glutamicibacter protophormiae]
MTTELRNAPGGSPASGVDAILRELPTEQGTLRYWEAGQGRPLVFLHGSGPGVSGWQNFGDVLPAFAEHFHCYVIEFPGFGVSDPTDKHPMPAASQAVIDLLDGLGLDKVDIIGNSMGGMVGTLFSMSHPERVRRLVTVGGLGLNAFAPFPAEGINLLIAFTEDPTRERLIQWLRSMVFDEETVTEELIEKRWALATEPKTLESARRMYSAAAMKAQIAAQAESDQPPAWSMLHKVKAKTLILWGRDDRVTPMDASLIPMRTIPDVELHVFPKCGHWAMIEQKQAFESVVVEFLNREEDAS